MLSPLAARQMRNAANIGPLEGATGTGNFGNRGDGPYLTLWLRVQEGRILKAAYASNACPSTMACGSMTCELIKGRTLNEARRLEPNDLIVVLGGLPEGKGACADMAIAALRAAIANLEDQEHA